MDMRSKKIKTGTKTNSFKMFKNVFSGTVILLPASSIIAIRSVKGLSFSCGICLVEV